MMKFECKDLGMDCDFVATAETKAEVMDLAMAHAAEVHGDMLKELSPEQTEEMNAKLETVITADDSEAIIAEDDETEKDEEAADEEGEEESTEVA